MEEGTRQTNENNKIKHTTFPMPFQDFMLFDTIIFIENVQTKYSAARSN